MNIKTNRRQFIRTTAAAGAGILGAPAILHAENKGVKLRVAFIGVGGIMAPQDALERLASGASLVQVYTGLIYYGPPLVQEIIDSVRALRNTLRSGASI